MNSSPAFRRALIALSHPVSIAAVIVVLLNDHWWRRVAPSWFTGKIGDCAWLIFAPFLLALLLAWLLPRREKIVGYAAIMGVGLIFGLAKTVPAFHTLTLDVLEFLTGWPNVLRMDPTDLIALPALVIAWWIWRQSVARSLCLTDRGWVLLPLAIFATMADSGPDFRGLSCLGKSGNSILASDYSTSYVSRDGGLSWAEETTEEVSRTDCGLRPKVMQDSNNPLVRFRLADSGLLERSEDGGKSWQTEHVAATMPEAQAVYLQRNWTDYGYPGYYIPRFDYGPMDAIMDPSTGNLILATGFQGVMVRTPDGEWHTIGVGPYQPIDLRQPDRVVSLLAGEGLLALVVFALAAATTAPGVLSRKVKVLLVLGWLALIGTLSVRVIFLQGNYTTMGEQLSLYGTLIAGGIAALVAAIRLIAAFRLSPTAAGITIGLSALTALLFLVPFIVWTQNGIPRYNAALLFAGMIVAAMCFAGYRYLQRYAIVPKDLTTT